MVRFAIIDKIHQCQIQKQKNLEQYFLMALFFWIRNRNFCFLSVVRPARTHSNGCKSLNRPDSGKVTAEGKGVRRETESEGSRRQTSGLTDRNPIKGLRVRIRLQKKSKSDNYPKSPKVNRADIRWKEYVHNWRGLAGERKRAVTTNCKKSAEAIVPA